MDNTKPQPLCDCNQGRLPCSCKTEFITHAIYDDGVRMHHTPATGCKTDAAADALLPALRQYRHNTGEGFVAAYELKAARDIVGKVLGAYVRAGEREHELRLLLVERNERIAAMAAALEHIRDVIDGQLTIIAQRAPGKYLDKTPMVRALKLHRQNANEALSSPSPYAKCHGNHGGPRCSDPECWNDSEVPVGIDSEGGSHD